MKTILKNNLLLAILLTFILAVSSTPAWGDSTNDNNAQTNSSGSNTQITGGYTATTTNNNDGQTNTTTSTTTNNSTTNGSDIPVGSANAPSYSAMSQDVCSMGVSGSVSTGVLGFSGGKHVKWQLCQFCVKMSEFLKPCLWQELLVHLKGRLVRKLLSSGISMMLKDQTTTLMYPN